MKTRSFFKFALICATAAMTTMAFTACDKGGDGGDDEGTGQITIPSGEKNQTVYADDAEKGITFTAKAPWTASVTAATRASSVAWVRLLVNGTEQYSGGAGTISLTIEMDLNTTGKDRAATITITSGTDEVSIAVLQKGVKVDNKPLTAADILTAHAWKHVGTTQEDVYDTGETDNENYADEYMLTFKADGSMTATGAGSDIFTDFFGSSPAPTYSIADGKLTMNVADENNMFDFVGPLPFDIVKLSDNELEFTVSGEGEYSDGENADGTTTGSSGTFVTTITMSFVKQ